MKTKTFIALAVASILVLGGGIVYIAVAGTGGDERRVGALETREGGGTIRWRGALDCGSTYEAYDVVSHNGSSWIATEQVAECVEPPARPWDLFAAAGVAGAAGGGLTWKGQFNEEAGYQKNDIVLAEGSAWIALQDMAPCGPNSGYCGYCQTPGSPQCDPDDPIEWALLASKGAKGDKGEAGAQGPQGPQGPAGAPGPRGPSAQLWSIVIIGPKVASTTFADSTAKCPDGYVATGGGYELSSGSVVRNIPTSTGPTTGWYVRAGKLGLDNPEVTAWAVCTKTL